MSSGTGGGSKMVRNLAVVAVVLFALIFLVRPTVVYVEPGHVGIVIHRGGGGVDDTPLGPGLHLRNPLFTSIEAYPTFMQTIVLAKSPTDGSANNDEINVNSVEGQPVSVDVSMSFEINPAKVPSLYKTFRTDINTIQHGFVKQAIRQSLQESMGTEEIAAMMGPKKAEVVALAQNKLQKRLEPYGLIVMQFTINELRAPTAVMEAISLKNVMQQQALTAQNELQKNQFQAQGDSIKAAGRAKAILAEAEAQAKANELLSRSITGNLVSYEMAKRWDGKMPQVTGGAMPMFQLPGLGGKPE
ncbi:MAG: prohibitin family protein [Phycisphaerae bacterium]|nr:prohibitin family protein [Gemmatimonadaceae bacterium]